MKFYLIFKSAFFNRQKEILFFFYLRQTSSFRVIWWFLIFESALVQYYCLKILSDVSNCLFELS